MRSWKGVGWRRSPVFPRPYVLRSVGERVVSEVVTPVPRGSVEDWVGRSASLCSETGLYFCAEVGTNFLVGVQKDTDDFPSSPRSPDLRVTGQT